MERLTKNWEIVSGCSRISEGCYSCPSYWEYLNKGLDYSTSPNNAVMMEPLTNKTPTNYMVAFGSDLFQSGIPVEFYDNVFKVMNQADWHTFEVATKRMELLLSLKDRFRWSDNIYIGTLVELAKYKHRINQLREVQSDNRYVSMTGLLGPLGSLNLQGIDTVIACGEYWGYQRPFQQSWIDDVERQCREQGVRFSTETRTYKDGAAV